MLEEPEIVAALPMCFLAIIGLGVRFRLDFEEGSFSPSEFSVRAISWDRSVTRSPFVFWYASNPRGSYTLQ